ncbi:MAG: hypothetical protein WCY41_02895 [Candidatus Micrarchaeia archaeon]
MTKAAIAEKILEAISESPISFYGLCRRTKLHPKTVKSYLVLIKQVQACEKVSTEQQGFRVMIRKKRASDKSAV